MGGAFRQLSNVCGKPRTPRTPQSRESHRLNGILTRLNSECWRTKFFKLRWEKSRVYKKRKFHVFEFPLFFSPRKARLLYFCFFLTYYNPNASNCRRQYELNDKRRGYTRAALSQKGTKFRRRAGCSLLDGGEAFFGGSDAVGLFDGHDEDFAVADFACVG